MTAGGGVKWGAAAHFLSDALLGRCRAQALSPDRGVPDRMFDPRFGIPCRTPLFAIDPEIPRRYAPRQEGAGPLRQRTALEALASTPWERPPSSPSPQSPWSRERRSR